MKKLLVMNSILDFIAVNELSQQKLTLQVGGEKLTGTATCSRSDAPPAGTLRGEDITFSCTAEYNGNAVTLTFASKVKGKSMSGSVSFNDSASDEWSASKP